MTPRRASLSVVFPAYNDASTIAGLVQRADETVRSLTGDYEIIVVNDGSIDETQAVLEALASQVPRLRIVRHERNRGYGGAIRSGFAQACKEVIFYTDGDAQYDPGELKALWAELADSVDLVQGYKIARRDPIHRLVIGKLYHGVVSAAFGLRVRDVDCDFRLIRRRVLERVALQHDSGVICVELVKKAQDAGFRIVEVPVHHYPRRAGRSQAFRALPVLRMLVDLTRLWRDVVWHRERAAMDDHAR